MPSSRRRDTLKAFTERAMEDPALESLIPPPVYLPSRLRGKDIRITADDIRLTIDPPSIKENHLRIAKADPLGFLIALMNGQPVPVFSITAEGAVKVRYEVADLKMRERIGKWMGARVTIQQFEIGQGGGREQKERMSNADDWDALVEGRDAARND